jgi:hypothetical protein
MGECGPESPVFQRLLLYPLSPSHALSHSRTCRSFVEYATPSQAVSAKAALSVASNFQQGRSMRVDWTDAIFTDLDMFHSRTLFIDRLPKTFLNVNAIRV